MAVAMITPHALMDTITEIPATMDMVLAVITGATAIIAPTIDRDVTIVGTTDSIIDATMEDAATGEDAEEKVVAEDNIAINKATLYSDEYGRCYCRSFS